MYVNIPTSNSLLGTYDHLINKDTKRPPVHRCRVALRCDDFRCNVLCNQSDNRPSNRNLRGPRPSVPTNEFVRKFAVHVIVSTNGICKKLLRKKQENHIPFFPNSPHCAPSAPSSASHWDRLIALQGQSLIT